MSFLLAVSFCVYISIRACLDTRQVTKNSKSATLVCAVTQRETKASVSCFYPGGVEKCFVRCTSTVSPIDIVELAGLRPVESTLYNCMYTLRGSISRY